MNPLKDHLPSAPMHPLTEPTLFYDPPYERPLEDEFAWHLVKYLAPIAALDYQRKAPTPAGPFWIDFVVEHGAQRVGFEIGPLADDGVDEAAEPVLRDALVLGTDAVDVLYRIRAADLFHRLHDVLRVVAAWDPQLFSERGRLNLTTLASPHARDAQPRRSERTFRLAYPADAHPDEDASAPHDLVVHRIDRAYPATWVRDYDRAIAHYGVTADRLGAGWARSA